MRLIFGTVYCIFILLAFSGASAGQNFDYMLCDKSIQRVAKSTFVPKKILIKIARLESSRRIEEQIVSWPWTLNNAGTGYYFSSKLDASEKLKQLIAAGKKNIDVGCMQLNIRWHARFFNSTSEMLSPFENVSYASRYLEQLYRETGSWEKTIKYYHSRNPKFNSVYYAKFREMSEPDMLRSSQGFLISDFQKKITILPTPAYDRNSLFWVVPQGIMLFASKSDITPAFKDIREFSVAPLVQSLQ